ncbi:MAG: hypothetical protein SCK29_05205 [Bacillota bacterium]|nr:hypothetical protein [Bacillota bacterium]
MEQESIAAFLVRESVYIVEDELEYFFTHKAKLLDMLLANITFSKTGHMALEEKLNETLVSSQDLEIILAKIQKRILRELQKADCKHTFHLPAHEISEGLPQFELAFAERLRTLKLGRSVAKGIDMAWKKASKSILPKALAGVSNKLPVGNYLVSALAVSPQEQEAEITASFRKVAAATLEQYRVELMNILVNKVTQQLFKEQVHNELETVYARYA